MPAAVVQRAHSDSIAGYASCPVVRQFFSGLSNAIPINGVGDLFGFTLTKMAEATAHAWGLFALDRCTRELNIRFQRCQFAVGLDALTRTHRFAHAAWFRPPKKTKKDLKNMVLEAMHRTWI